MASKSEKDTALVFWHVVPSPLGRLLLVAGPTGLYRVAFADEDFATILSEAENTFATTSEQSAKALEEPARELEEYFAGDRTEFDVKLDLREIPQFSRTVLGELREIPYGETISYGELAEIAKSPGAARAVGSACANNRLPIFIPCHRVVRADKAPGGYRGGAGAKAYLRRLETDSI